MRSSNYEIWLEAVKYDKHFRQSYVYLRDPEQCNLPATAIRAYYNNLSTEDLTPSYLDPATGETKRYRVEFWPEVHFLSMAKMPPESILAYYLSVGRDVIRSNDRYRRHNLSLTPMDDDTGNRKVRHGSQRQKSGKADQSFKDGDRLSWSYENDGEVDLEITIHEPARDPELDPEQALKVSEDDRFWASLRATVYSLATYDYHDSYVEGAELLWQIGEQFLADALRSLSERDREILNLLTAGAKRVDIAAYLDVAPSTVTRVVQQFAKKIEAEARERHFLTSSI